MAGMRTLDAIDWTGVDAVDSMSASRVCQRETLGWLSAVGGAPWPDGALRLGDGQPVASRWPRRRAFCSPVRSAADGGRARPPTRSRRSISPARRPGRTRSIERCAFILNYHFVRPRAIARRARRRAGLHARRPACAPGLPWQDDFAFVTLGELLDPARRLPESVALVTFDDALKDVFEWAGRRCCDRSAVARHRVPGASWP